MFECGWGIYLGGWKWEKCSLTRMQETGLESEHLVSTTFQFSQVFKYLKFDGLFEVFHFSSMNVWLLANICNLHVMGECEKQQR